MYIWGFRDSCALSIGGSVGLFVNGLCVAWPGLSLMLFALSQFASLLDLSIAVACEST